MSNSDNSFGGILLFIYLAISQIMTVVFFVQYCKVDDSMLKIIVIDPILSEIKGLLWIFFVW